MKKCLELLDRRCNRRDTLCVVDTHILMRISTILHSFFLSKFFFEFLPKKFF